mmetsp:Transcript_20397/g.51679  ORF Transcript_20397/g.51679 Transcript_20397/m.51679 type:complete len:208 (-) Transcript_20397:110-733(-)
MDGCVGPFGLMASSAAYQCRVGYEHKQSPRQKQAYKANNPTKVQQQQQQQQQEEEAGKGSVRYSAKCKGQTVAAIIGAYAHNSFPFLLDLTDGEVHHILQLQGSELVAWTGLTPTQAYFKQAQLLKEHQALLAVRSLTLEDIPEELQVPLQKARTLVPTSPLMEQLDSIIPGLETDVDKLRVSYELMLEWSCCGQLEMPAAAQAMYG